MADLWDNNNAVTDLGIDVPAWIEQDITPADVAAIIQGGCASGAYMPAVTYHKANATMAEHGDEVLDFINNEGFEVPAIDMNDSWAGYASKVLSYAVEMWAHSVQQEISDALDDRAEDNSDA